jgi:hypothetical protein
MFYAHDVWVNFIEGCYEEAQIPEFFEWRGTETPLLVEEAPVVFLTTELYNFIANDYEELPSQLLNAIYQKGIMGKNRRVDQERMRMDYLAIICSPDCRLMVIQVDSDGLVMWKSKLAPRSENYICGEVYDDTEFLDYGWEPKKEEEEKETNWKNGLLNPTGAPLLGLTRKERELKEILFEQFVNLLQESEASVKYWFSEVFPDSLNPKPLPKDDMVFSLYEYFRLGWTPRHESFGTSLVKYFESKHALGAPTKKQWDYLCSVRPDDHYKKVLG